MEGWLKLHRQSLHSAAFEDANVWKVWCWCLMRTNHKERKIIFGGQEVTLCAGQFISGRFAGAEECNMKPSTFRNCIDRLKLYGNLNTKSDNKKTIFTIVKWNCFQSLSDFQDNKRTARGHRQERKNERSNAIDTMQYLDREENGTN